MATGFLLATCCSDPGIIPRREVQQGSGRSGRSSSRQQVVIATKTAQQLQERLGYAETSDARQVLCGPFRSFQFGVCHAIQ